MSTFSIQHPTKSAFVKWKPPMSIRLDIAGDEVKRPVAAKASSHESGWTLVVRKRPRPSQRPETPVVAERTRTRWILRQMAMRDKIDNLMDGCSCEEDVMDMLGTCYDDKLRLGH
jgi:hypothetical protein